MKKILAVLVSSVLIAPSTGSITNAKVLTHFECSGMVSRLSTGNADLSIGGGDSMCYFISESAIGKRILRTCHIGLICRVIGTVKNDDSGGDWSPIIIDVTDVTKPKPFRHR
jgi:hypothetical protein